MKKLILLSILLIVGSLFNGCMFIPAPPSTENMVHQALSLAVNIKQGMTTEEVLEIMDKPVLSELDRGIEEWHYCNTDRGRDTYIALYFMNNKIIAKKYYEHAIPFNWKSPWQGLGSCELFVKKGYYKMPPDVQEILDKNN